MAVLAGLLVAPAITGGTLVGGRDFQRPDPFSRIAGQAMRVFFLLSSVLVCLLGRIREPRPLGGHAAGGILPHRPRRDGGADAAGRELPSADAVRGPGDGDGRLLHPRELLRRQPEDAGGRPEVPGHRRAQLGPAPFRHRAALRRRGQSAASRPTPRPACTIRTWRGFLAANPHNFVASIGIVLVLAGAAFKIGAVPFQIWIPDVYQGAPTPVTAFLAVSSKAAGFAVLLVWCVRSSPPTPGWSCPSWAPWPRPRSFSATWRL